MPLVPIATEYTASATDLIDCTYHCSRCGIDARASVLATSVGSSTGAPLGIGAYEHERRARDRAAQSLDAEARALASLARCPSCGRRDTSVLRGAWIHVAPLALFVGALIAAPTSIFAILFRVSPWLVGIVLALAVASFYALRRIRALCARADRFVELH